MPIEPNGSATLSRSTDEGLNRFVADTYRIMSYGIFMRNYRLPQMPTSSMYPPTC